MAKMFFLGMYPFLLDSVGTKNSYNFITFCCMAYTLTKKV